MNNTYLIEQQMLQTMRSQQIIARQNTPSSQPIRNPGKLQTSIARALRLSHR